MTDWTLVGKIVGGGFGVTIFVLVVLSLVSWIMGLIIQRITKSDAGEQGETQKG